MIKQHLMLALVGTALVAAPALAQNQQPSSSTPSGSPPAAAQPSSPSGSSASAQSGGSAQFISQAKSGQWRASKLVGVDIYGSNNEKIGDVNEVLLDKMGKAEALVIGVGGFLGVGSKEVAVPFNAVEWKDQPPPSTSASSTTSTSGAGGTASRPGGMTSGSSSTATSSAPKVMDYPDHGVLKMTKDQLTNAPEFKYASDTSSRSGSTTPSTNR
jgi:sporulation protein YlmC with PRC-barrel domain